MCLGRFLRIRNCNFLASEVGKALLIALEPCFAEVNELVQLDELLLQLVVFPDEDREEEKVRLLLMAIPARLIRDIFADSWSDEGAAARNKREAIENATNLQDHVALPLRVAIVVNIESVCEVPPFDELPAVTPQIALGSDYAIISLFGLQDLRSPFLFPFPFSPCLFVIRSSDYYARHTVGIVSMRPFQWCLRRVEALSIYFSIFFLLHFSSSPSDFRLLPPHFSPLLRL